MSDTNGLRAALANAHNALELYHAYGWPDRLGVRAALRVQIDALAATQPPAPSAPEQPSAQAVRNVQGAAKMVANMLERDGTPVRAEAAEELLKAVGELAGLAEQPSAAVEAERDAARSAQVSAVMPLIGPLLDAWECSSQACREELPELDKQLRRINRAMEDSAPPEPLRVGALTACNCRWDGDKQVQQCTLHEAHVDAIHEWAERAKSAEAKLATQPTSAAADVDALAQFIRSIDGWSRMGAGVLAEHICEWIAATPTPAPAAQGEAVAVVGDCFSLLWLGGGSFAEHAQRHGIKVGSKLYTHAAPERAEVRPPVLTESYPLADALYRAGYEDRSRGRDYDPRGCLEWQSVVDAITPPSAADSAQGQQQGEAQP